MFGNLGLHVIHFPSGKWGYVGSIPTVLGTEVPATRADVMGCRTHRNAAGEIVVWKFPVFETEAAAREFAIERGCKFPATEPTPEGLQYVIPGCEKDQTRNPNKQMELF